MNLLNIKKRQTNTKKGSRRYFGPIILECSSLFTHLIPTVTIETGILDRSVTGIIRDLLSETKI